MNPRRSPKTRTFTPSALAFVATLLVAVGTVPAPVTAQDLADEEELRVFEADLGPAWIDVSAYPEDQRQAYSLFARKCSKCHTLARPVNSQMRGDEWIAYVTRMSRKPGSGITPKDQKVVLAFLIYDSERRARSGSVVDPELEPFLEVSRELGGVRRFPASLRDIRLHDGELRITVEGDRRLDLSRFLAKDAPQKLVKWTRRTPNRGEIVIEEGAIADGGSADAIEATTDPALLAVLEEAVGSESDPEERIELILDWMDETITREYREGIADVATVLADPRGDATEFASTFVALTRASGVPARLRLGLVARRTSFYLHPWAEVWLDGWVPVDPYLGQLPADATRIALTVPGDDPFTDWDATRVPGYDRLKLRVVVPEDELEETEG